MAFRLTRRAESDIEDIVFHIAADSPVAAVRWQEMLLKTCRRLGEMPGLGVARPDVRPDLRLFPVGAYLILYRTIGNGAEIVRVLHGARAWQDLLS